MSDSDVAGLVAAGVIRRTEMDEATARVELATARSHLESAAALAGSDPNAAFQLAYDATRKSIVAHMRAKGFRVGSGAGGHVKTGRYAAAALDDPALARHIVAFDDMRTVRNQSEYDALLLDERDAQDALEHAQAIITGVERDLE